MLVPLTSDCCQGRLCSNNSYDVVLLQELWMRPDHQTIKSHLPDGYQMSGLWKCYWGISNDELLFLTRCGRLGSCGLWWQSRPDLLLRPGRRDQVACQVKCLWLCTALYVIRSLQGSSNLPPFLSMAASGALMGNFGQEKELGGWDSSPQPTCQWTYWWAPSVPRTPTPTTDRSRRRSSEKLSGLQTRTLY